MSLLCSLHEACRREREPLGVGLAAVHVNHGLRGKEADEDERFVLELCARMGIPLEIRRVNVPEYREATESTVEEAARNLRYEVFEAILTESTVDDLLTAHTLDDQAETVLMKILRGAWTEGLSGIHPVLRLRSAATKRILRPLLETSRAQILAYLEERGQPWREDATNRDMVHTRNRIRHRLLPLLRAENPGLDRTLANLAEVAREEEDHWQDSLTRLLPRVLLPGSPARGGGRAVSSIAGTSTVALEIEQLRSLDRATRRRVLRAAARSLQPVPGSLSSSIRLSFNETARLLALCGFQIDPTISSRPGTVLRLNPYLLAKRSARELTLSLDRPLASARSGTEQ